MKKIENYFKIGMLLIGTLFFTNCEKEESLGNYSEVTTKNDVKYTVPSILTAKDNFQNLLKSSNTLDNSKNFIDWDNSESLIFKENINILYTPIRYNKKGKRTKSFVASVTNDNNVESFIFSIFYANDSTNEIFSGYISKFDTHGNAIEIYKYEKGQLKTTYTFKKNKKINNKNKNYLSKRARRGGNCGDCGDCGITREELNILFDTIEDDEPINMLDCVEIKSSPRRENNIGQTYFGVRPRPSAWGNNYWNSPPKKNRIGVHLVPRNNYDDDQINKIPTERSPLKWFYEELRKSPLESDSLVKPHCSSFEYAKPPGSNYAGCAVNGMTNTFYAFTSTHLRPVLVVFPTLYFSMPLWMNNGVAATKTAEAVDKAFEATEDWFADNPYVMKGQVEQHIHKKLKAEMIKIKGNVSSETSPFPIPNPAPYVTTILFTGNCN